jgi:hypothetical protein
MRNVDEKPRERVEAISLRTVGVCFIVLAIYVAFDSVKSLNSTRSTGGKPGWYCSSRRLAGNHAVTRAGEEKSCSGDQEQRVDGRFQTNRTLHLSFANLA